MEQDLIDLLEPEPEPEGNIGNDHRRVVAADGSALQAHTMMDFVHNTNALVAAEVGSKILAVLHTVVEVSQVEVEARHLKQQRMACMADNGTRCRIPQSGDGGGEAVHFQDDLLCPGWFPTTTTCLHTSAFHLHFPFLPLHWKISSNFRQAAQVQNLEQKNLQVNHLDNLTLENGLTHTETLLEGPTN